MSRSTVSISDHTGLKGWTGGPVGLDMTDFVKAASKRPTICKNRILSRLPCLSTKHSMYLSYGSFAIVCACVAVVWFWHDGLRARDVANAAAMAACERIGLQFLDGTAAFSRLRLSRVDGRLRLR